MASAICSEAWEGTQPRVATDPNRQQTKTREDLFGGLGRGEGGEAPSRLYKAPTDKTKPQQTIKSPDRLYKAPEY